MKTIIGKFPSEACRSTRTSSSQVCNYICNQLRHFSWLANTLPPQFWFGQLYWGSLDPTRLVSWGHLQGIYLYGIRGGRDHSIIIHGCGCGAIVDTFPYGSALLEESLAFMGIVQGQQNISGFWVSTNCFKVQTIILAPNNQCFFS